MDTYAVIELGVVTNVIIWSSEWSAPEGALIVKLPPGSVAGIGSTYDGSKFSAPPNVP